MASPFKTCWANPWVRRPLLLALALSVVLGGSWCVVDQLGKKAWRALQTRLAAEGETTDFRALLAPPIPDAENFCAIAPLRNIAAKDTDHSAAGEEGRANRARIDAAMKLRSLKQSMHGLQKGTPLDFAAMAEEMRQDGTWPMPTEPGEAVQDVNTGLAKWDPFIAELAAGLGRPRAQWTPCQSERGWQRPYITSNISVSPVLLLGKALSLRAAVAGTAGDVPKAIASLRISSRLALASAAEPTLINTVVVLANETGAIQAIWELCRARQGTAGDWVQFEQLTRAYDPRAAILRGYRSELASVIDAIFFARDTRQRDTLMMLLPGMHDFPPTPNGPLEHLAIAGLNVAPPGFFHAVATENVSGQMTYMIRPLRDEGWLAYLAKVRALKARVKPPATLRNLPEMMTRESLEMLAPIAAQAMKLQVALDQAAIACVLERARLAGGSYPASLEGLTLADGHPLPLDACTGRPMHYRQTPEGRYVLWSEGPDGRDDNATRGAGATALEHRGDWVWGFDP